MTDAVRALRRLLADIAAEQGYRRCTIATTPISTGGANYTSGLYLVTVTANGKPPLELFAKVAAIGKEARADSPVGRMYELERRIYEEVAPAFIRLQIDRSLPREHVYKFPKFYGCNDKFLEETIVLENLAAKGYKSYDRFESVDWNYASKSIEELAKFHALSFAYGDEYPEEYEKLLKEMEYKLAGDPEQLKPFAERMIASAVSVVKEKNREKVINFCSEEKNNYLQFLKPIRRAALVHGDYRPSNLMHKVNEDGKMEVITVDYQTVYTGCPLSDIVYFVITGSDSAFRKRYLHKLTDHYYAELCNALRRLNVDPENVYPKEDFDHEWKKILPFGILFSIFVLPLVTVETANAPKVDNLNTKDFLVKPSELFEVRMNGIVDDYIEWGIL